MTKNIEIIKRGLNELANEYFALSMKWKDEGNEKLSKKCWERYKEYEQSLVELEEAN